MAERKLPCCTSNLVLSESITLLARRTRYEITPEIWPLLLFLTIAMSIGVKRYRQTLD